MILHGINLEQTAIRDFCVNWKISDLRVFGSIPRSDFRLDSDIDFLADFDDSEDRDVFDHMDMEDELSLIVGRTVDIVSRSAIEASGNRFYISEILFKAEPVIAKRYKSL
jgi:hypothetical protein